MTELPAIPQFETPGALRRSLRDSAYPHPTFGAAPGYLQCNLLILPHGLARDFSSFCAANAQACPVIYQSAPGQYDFPELGENIDLRSDVGSYRVFRDGQAIGDLLDLGAYWQGDFVTFLIGSSFGLDGVLARDGIETPWIDRGETPAHYITGRESKPGGPFRGPLAVSMRPMTPEAAERARELCAAYPHLHGLPLAIGDPDELGIESLDAPVAGIDNTTSPAEGEVPVFWASALTVQLALSAARLPFCITNTPGYLLVTDVEVDALREAPLELTDRADDTAAGLAHAEIPDAEAPDPELDIPAAITAAPEGVPPDADEAGAEALDEAGDEAASGTPSGTPYPIAVTHLPGAPRHAAAADEADDAKEDDAEAETELALEEDDAETLVVSGDDLAASGLSDERLPGQDEAPARVAEADAGEPAAVAPPEAESREAEPEEAVEDDRNLFGETAAPGATTDTVQADASSGEAEAEDKADDEDALELPFSDIVEDHPMVEDRPVSASRLVRERLAAARMTGGDHHSATGAS